MPKISYKPKNLGNMMRKRTDCCPKCSEHFRKKKTRVLWRDVVECILCGHIWVLANDADFNRWK